MRRGEASRQIGSAISKQTTESGENVNRELAGSMRRCIFNAINDETGPHARLLKTLVKTLNESNWKNNPCSRYSGPATNTSIYVSTLV